MQLSRPFRPRFHYASGIYPLSLLHIANSLGHSSIGTLSPRRGGALTHCEHIVSGSISLPLRGSFNLSLAVLVHYRWEVVFSLGAWSPQFHTRFHVSGATREHHLFATKILRKRLSRSMVVLSRLIPLSFCKNYVGPTTPTNKFVGLDCSLFARHY